MQKLTFLTLRVRMRQIWHIGSFHFSSSQCILSASPKALYITKVRCMRRKKNITRKSNEILLGYLIIYNYLQVIQLNNFCATSTMELGMKIHLFESCEEFLLYKEIEI